MPAEAVKRAKAGELLVKMVVVTEPRLRTVEDVGVGSTFKQLGAAYATRVDFTLPGLWEEPSCVAKPSNHSMIHFFMAECEGGTPQHDATVIRVVVTNAGKN